MNFASFWKDFGGHLIGTLSLDQQVLLSTVPYDDFTVSKMCIDICITTGV